MQQIRYTTASTSNQVRKAFEEALASDDVVAGAEEAGISVRELASAITIDVRTSGEAGFGDVELTLILIGIELGAEVAKDVWRRLVLPYLEMHLERLREEKVTETN